jgi:hypothetical protein
MIVIGAESDVQRGDDVGDDTIVRLDDDFDQADDATPENASVDPSH